MKNLFITIPFILSIVFCSCNDLSRSKAKKLILDKKDVNWSSIDMTALFNNGLGCYDISCREIKTQNQNSFEQRLIEAGYVKHEMNYFGTKYFSLTNKILLFNNSERSSRTLYYFKLAEVEDINITGISGNDDYKKVEFTISYIPTDIGKLVLDPSSLTKQKSLTFEKYDDGWRF